MFLQVSVCPGGGRVLPLGRHPPTSRQTPPRQTPPLGRHPSPQNDHCSGQYASYWNAFLFKTFLEDISPFAGADKIPCFGLPMMSTLGFKDMVDPLLACFTSGATRADLLTVSMANELFLSTY